MVSKAQIVTFLRTNPYINKVNFDFRGFYVYPSAYQVDVADAIDSGEIEICASTALGGAGAEYDFAHDSLNVDPATFDPVKNLRDQAYLVHEATHAHQDIKHLGSRPGDEIEAIAYLAEAVFLAAQGAAPMVGSGPVPGSVPLCRAESHRVAGALLSGTYTVPAAEVTALLKAVNGTPGAVPLKIYISNGFDRDLTHRLTRHLGTRIR